MKKAMKNIRFIIIYLLFVVLVTSCENVIEFKGKSIDNFIVVNSVLEADSNILCSVTVSKSAFSNADFITLKDANVELYIDGELSAKMVYDAFKDVFLAPDNIKAEIGKEYSIKVQHPKYKDVEATCIIEPKINATVQSIEFGESEIENDYYYEGSPALKFKVELEDKPGEDFYQIAVFVPEITFNEDLDLLGISKPIVYSKLKHLESRDEVLNHNVYKGSDDFSDVDPNDSEIFNDALFDGEKRLLEFEAILRNVSFSIVEQQIIDEFKSLIKIDIKKISKDLYLYKRTNESIFYNEGNPFSELIKLHTNISGGAGIWGASTSNIIRLKNH